MNMPTEIATFACGCFWTKQYKFSRLPGVVATRTGYTGGHTEQPTYTQVCSKTTGHAEAVEVTFDPAVVAFTDLLRFFFSLHDPTIDRRERGGQYRSGIFYHTEEQRIMAGQVLDELREKDVEPVTQVVAAGAFWAAEERHQDWCERTGIGGVQD